MTSPHWAGRAFRALLAGALAAVLSLVPTSAQAAPPTVMAITPAGLRLAISVAKAAMGSGAALVVVGVVGLILGRRRRDREG